MKHLARIAATVVLVIFFPTFQQCLAAIAEPGWPAPALHLSAVVKGPALEEISLEKLKGKVVVLEFWATWCGPCIAAFPHINKLVKEYEGKPDAFVSISVDAGSGDMEKIVTTLKSRPLNTWVVKDGASNPTAALYRADAIPTTVLINRDGIVDAVTDPFSVNEDALDSLLAGKPSGIASKTPPRYSPTQSSASATPLYSVSIAEDSTHSNSNSFFSARGEVKSFGVNGYSTNMLVAWLYNVEQPRVIVDDSVPEKYWKCQATRPETMPESIPREHLKAVLPHAMGLTVTEGSRPVSVYVLRCPAGAPSGAQTAFTRVEDTGGSYSGFNGIVLTVARSTMPVITQLIGRAMNEIVVDETGLSGNYDLALGYSSVDIEGFKKKLRACGLELTHETRVMNVVSVGKKIAQNIHE